MVLFKQRSISKFFAAILLVLFLNSFIMVEQIFAAEKINFSYIYSVSKNNYVKAVDKTNKSVDIISPNYYELSKEGSLVTTSNFDANFIKEMHDRGIKVIPFLSNSWDKEAGINGLSNTEILSTNIVEEVIQNNLDGINIDIEGLSHLERDQFSNFIKALSKKMPSDKDLSVAVAANPKGSTTGWHGSYDYKALGEYADYLIIMAYDESYRGSDPGPVASIDFVEKSIEYAVKQGVPNKKIVLGIPFYGRIWRLEDLETGNGVIGDGIWMNKITNLLDQYGGTFEFNPREASFVGRVSIDENDPPYQLFTWKEAFKQGTYEVWFDNEQTIQKKLELVNKYNLKGTANWSLGQESLSLWDKFKSWLNPAVVAYKDTSKSGTIAESPDVESQPSSNIPKTVKRDPSKIDVFVNGEVLAFDQLPIIQSGRTLVPLRGIFEALGAAVQWDPFNKEITATNGIQSVWLKANSTTTKVNGKSKKIEVPAQIIKGRTMVPLRFIGESFDAFVNWDDKTRTVVISK